MVPLGHARGYSPRSETLAVVVTNALPLVGVVALGWDLAALLFLYWLELGILAFWALVRALFAGRPSEFDSDPLIAGPLASKPVAVPIPRTGLGVHLSTLPVLVVATPVLALIWFFAGATTVGVLGADTPDPDTLMSVMVAAFGLLLGEGLSTALEYFRRQGYREHSAQTAIRGVFMRGAAIGVGGMFTATIVGLGADAVSTDDPITAVDPTVVGLPLLVGIVLVKFSFDLAGLYRDRLVEFDEATPVELGWAYDPPTRDSIEPVRANAHDRLRPTVLGRLLGGISMSNARRHPGAWYVGGGLLLVAALFATGRVWDVVLLFAAGSVVAPLGLLTIDYWMRYGGVEYRVDDDAIVAYDRLFRTRLWRIEPWDESGVLVERERLDRWLDTSTVVIECPDRKIRLPRLETVEPLLDVFDRPVRVE